MTDVKTSRSRDPDAAHRRGVAPMRASSSCSAAVRWWLVGMMGAGKTSVGKRLAGRLGLTFIDADTAIEEAAKKSVPEIFAEHGEDYFRQGERRVIARLLRQPRQIIATGGGAFMNAETRAAIRGARRVDLAQGRLGIAL